MYLDPSLRIFNVLADGSFSETDLNNLLNVTSGDGYVNLNCRTVRIGSYKITPRSPVTLSQYGLRIVIPDINNGMTSEIFLYIVFVDDLFNFFFFLMYSY